MIKLFRGRIELPVGDAERKGRKLLEKGQGFTSTLICLLDGIPLCSYFYWDNTGLEHYISFMYTIFYFHLSPFSQSPYLFCLSPTPSFRVTTTLFFGIYVYLFGLFIYFLFIFTYEWNHMVFVFLWFMSLSIISWKSIHVVTSGRFHPFVFYHVYVCVRACVCLYMIQLSPLLGIYSKNINTLIQKDIYTPIFITALFTVAKTWKQPVYQQMNE